MERGGKSLVRLTARLARPAAAAAESQVWRRWDRGVSPGVINGTLVLSQQPARRQTPPLPPTPRPQSSSTVLCGLSFILWTFLFPPPRLRDGGVPRPVSPGLQAERLDGLDGLQRPLWRGPEDQVQVAPGEGLQRRAALPQAGHEEPGEGERCTAPRCSQSEAHHRRHEEPRCPAGIASQTFTSNRQEEAGEVARCSIGKLVQPGGAGFGWLASAC